MVNGTFALPPPPPVPSADLAGRYPIPTEGVTESLTGVDVADDWSAEAAAMRPGFAVKLAALQQSASRALEGLRGLTFRRRGPKMIRSKLGPWVIAAPKTSGELMMERAGAFVRSPLGAVLIAAVSVSLVFCTMVIVLSDSPASALALSKPSAPKAPDPPPVAAAPPALPVAPAPAEAPSAPTGPSASASRAERPAARRRVRRGRRGGRRAAARRGGRGRGRPQIASRSSSSSSGGRSSSAARDIAALLGN